MHNPETIVRDFCAAWSHCDVDRLLAYSADDAIWEDVPLPPRVGKPAIREALNPFGPAATAAEFEVLNIAVRDNVVFTERVDRFTIGGKPVVVRVAGVFEVRDGKIGAWRDYSDIATFRRQLA